MNMPNIEDLIRNVGNKYTLCIQVSKRAREIANYITARDKMERINIIKPLVDIKSNDPVEIALNEIKEGKVGFVGKEDEVIK